MLCVGAIFIPSLALAADAWMGNSLLFEVIYIAWWYVGAINHVILPEQSETWEHGLSRFCVPR